jgi:hypothetical protein
MDKRKASKYVVLSSLLLIGLAVSAQQEASVEKARKVVAGSDITFTIVTDRPATVPGIVGLKASPIRGGAPPETGGFALVGKTATIKTTLSLKAKPGKWKIDEVWFAPIAASNKRTVLNSGGDLTFEVAPHEPLVFPSKATVDIR